MSIDKQNIYSSNGNLIITGEYFVLAGAKALAVPLLFGQQMKVEASPSNLASIHWTAVEQEKPWFEAKFVSENINIENTNNHEIALKLQALLKSARILNPKLFAPNFDYKINCNIDFSTSWGWGSSATLISNIAKWADIDAFALNKMVSSGSGYDIAASKAETPIIYQLKEDGYEVTPIKFNPPFKENIHFVYLGRKQDSSQSVKEKLELIKGKEIVSEITELTEKIAAEQSMDEFIKLIAEHEQIVSETINIERVKQTLFKDFEGEIKSLGAWGGDFAMVVSPLAKQQVRDYFKNKGLSPLFSFDEIINK